jgi:hypothetical protein
MNFNQWRNYAAKSAVAKVTYVCGDESTLVELVLDDIKSILNVPVTDYVVVDASQAEHIWELASQYPLDPNENRLLVVRHADRINSWNELPGWIAQSRNNPKNFIVFISELADAPAIYSKGKKVSYADHIELIRTKGKFIKCSQPNDEDLVKWCESAGLTRQAAEFLIQRTSADVEAIQSVLIKVHVWNGSPSAKALQLFCDEQQLDSLADYLILLNKKSAFLALKNLNEDDYVKVISRLDSRLDMMVDLHRCLARRMYDADIVTSTGIKIFLVKKFKSVAKEYDPKKIKHCRQLITMIDGQVRAGVRTGAFQCLISLW